MLYTLGRHRQVFWGSSVSLSLMSHSGALEQTWSSVLQHSTVPQPGYSSFLCCLPGVTQSPVGLPPPEYSRAESSPEGLHTELHSDENFISSHLGLSPLALVPFPQTVLLEERLSNEPGEGGRGYGEGVTAPIQHLPAESPITSPSTTTHVPLPLPSQCKTSFVRANRHPQTSPTVLLATSNQEQMPPWAS